MTALVALALIRSVATAPGVAVAGSATPCDTPSNPRQSLEDGDSPAVESSASGTTTALTRVGCPDA